MSDPARHQADQDHPGPLAEFPADPPALEGELVCVCGAPEGLHRSDGASSVVAGSPCDFFVPFDDAEEQTRPDIRVEYESDCDDSEVR